MPSPVAGQPMNDVIIQQPSAIESSNAHLFLLLHGVGGSAEDLKGLASALAARHPDAWVVNVQAPDPCDLGRGWQWFSVRGVTPGNRAERVAAAMPGLLQTVAAWQQRSGVGAAGTTLIGFSQGAIMALAAAQRPVASVSRVVSIAGRLAGPAQPSAAGTRVHLLHGEDDDVVPTEASIQAHAQLAALNAHVTLDLFPGLSHGIDASVLARLWERLAA